jgi:DNA-directed RNA polymerase subunit RPC12/RpoP
MKKINESFICVWCGKEVPLATKTCRNHCPFCFVSLHVDGDIPGDRATSCGGKMFPIAYELRNSDYKILFRCEKCWKEHRNKRAEDDEIVRLPELIDGYKKLME